ncbi:MAG TPA: hypothetical protein VEH76_10485 [Methylocystis sp.]|nr:hypothetical protein [Methylocystis sp.]
MDAIFRRAERAFWFALATLFLIESWLWDHVKEWLRLLARALGVERIEAWIAAFVKDLSPSATLVVFGVPVLVILPFKVAAVALIASGHFGWGLALILAAKTLGLGVTAFLFDLCREKLLQLAWFERFYRLVLRARAWAHELVEPVRVRLRQWRAAVGAALAPYLARRGEFARRLQLVFALARRGGRA